ncbi:VOC family protein [Pseudoalteromonas fenneropenaei]|uniref:VOC family protein n=1 Tax=Pseudoalteromonas fenneropenaei TaxID=1737459 RepID=A0ABV7CJE2_9GAMM
MSEVQKQQAIIHISLVVNDYDEAIHFYVNKLGFELLEDSYQAEQDKRWVVVAPPGGQGATLLLAKASSAAQSAVVGSQSGGRVFLFLRTDDFGRDYHAYVAKGIEFVRAPSEAEYGTVAVFADLYGNLWDLIELKAGHSLYSR